MESDTTRLAGRGKQSARQSQKAASAPAAPTPATPASRSKSRKVPALDGMRTLAILAIVIYHANASWLPGGFFGVSVFFTITGYLTALSVQRATKRSGGFNYGRYLLGRVKRLLPTMLAVVGATIILSALLADNLLAKVKSDAVPALLFIENIYYIVRNVSYFAASGLPSPLTHFWYLGVVMQFYIVWPLLQGPIVSKARSKKLACAIVALLIIASAVEMYVLYDPHADTNRIYYGPDARAAEFLVGVLCAFWTGGRGWRWHIPWQRTKGGKRKEVPAVVYDVVALVSLVVIAVLMFTVDGYSSFSYQGGFLLASVLTALIIGVVARPRRGLVSKALGWRPLAGAGARSFAVYLWHYPLLIILNPATRTTALPWWGWALEFLLIAVVSEVSWRIFEAPRKGGASGEKPALLASGAKALASSAAAVKQRATKRGAATDGKPAKRLGASAESHAEPDAAGDRGKGTSKRKARADGIRKSLLSWQSVPALVIEAAAIIAVAVILVVPVDAEETQTVADSTVQSAAAEDPGYDFTGTYYEGTSFAEAAQIIESMSYEVDTETGATDVSVLLIGDSVSAGAVDQFEEIFPNGHIDSEVGRQLYTGIEVYEQCVEDGYDCDVVVWALGANGVAREDDVRELIEICGDKQVYFVTVRVPLALQDINNALFVEIAEEYDNVDIIDWYAESTGHDEYFWSDGTHLRPDGAEAYVLMLRKAIVGR